MQLAISERINCTKCTRPLYNFNYCDPYASMNFSIITLRSFINQRIIIATTHLSIT